MAHKTTHPILVALREVTAELDLLARGESCDHSVGICWCPTFRALAKAKDILAKNGLELHKP